MALGDPSSFTDGENWTGGFYELAIELGDRDDVRLALALATVWADPLLDGPYLRRDDEPSDQERVEPTLASQEVSGFLRGRATMPEGQVVLCGTLVIREEEGSDWLDFYLPVGSLARADARVGAYPFGSVVTIGDDKGPDDSMVWRAPIDRWMIVIAKAVFARVPFRLGLIGWEMSGNTCAAEVGEIPGNRGATYLVPDGDLLRIYPATT